MSHGYTFQVGSTTLFVGTLSLFKAHSKAKQHQAQLQLPRFASEPVVIATAHAKSDPTLCIALHTVPYHDIGDSALLTFATHRDPATHEWICNYVVVGELAEG
jgi:hypothetical protein